MQTLRFTRTLARIVTELKAKELVDFLSPFLDRAKNVPIPEGPRHVFSTLLFESRVGFAELMKDSDASKILQTMKINEVYAPPQLGRLLALFNNVPNSPAIFQAPDVFAPFFTFNDMLLWLVRLAGACSQILEVERVGETTNAAEVVELELVDFDGTGIEADRVNQVFASLTELHLNLARIFDLKDDRLKILYLDSGSNLFIGLKAGTLIVTAIKLLFKEVWEKIKYRRFEDFDRKVESLSKGLTLNATIDEQVKNKVLDEHTGKNLQVRVLSEVVALVGAGAMLPADEISEKVDQRKLLAEKRGVKLLGSGNTGDGGVVGKRMIRLDDE